MMTTFHDFEGAKYVIATDDRVVWINSGSGLLGRFSKLGIDVHADPEKPEHAGQHCLVCTHEYPGIGGWNNFKGAMWKHHRISLKDHHRPSWVVERCIYVIQDKKGYRRRCRWQAGYGASKHLCHMHRLIFDRRLISMGEAKSS